MGTDRTKGLILGLGAIALGAAAAEMVRRWSEEQDTAQLEFDVRARFSAIGKDRQAGFDSAMREVASAIKAEYDWLDDPSDSDTSELVGSEVLTRLMFRFELMQELGRGNGLTVLDKWQEYLPQPAE